MLKKLLKKIEIDKKLVLMAPNIRSPTGCVPVDCSRYFPLSHYYVYRGERRRQEENKTALHWKQEELAQKNW